MKVLFIARRFPPSVGGMERFAFDLSNALSEKAELYKITWGGKNIWLPVVLPWFFIRAAIHLITNPDTKIIHMQDAVQAPIGWLLSKIFRKPYIVVAHGLDITYDNAFYQHVILPFVRRADKVISISRATNDEVELRNVKNAKTTVITLGVHDDYGDPKPEKAKLAESIGVNLSGKTTLLTTGRLVKRKGVAWFIENVLPQVTKKDQSIVYIVAGDGAEKEAIQKAIDKSGMSYHVHMLGRVSDEVRSLLYQSCDMFIMPNIKVPGDMEGFGIVVHEAATAGLPVIAANLEGIRDALHDGKNGVMLQTQDVNAFEKEILGFAKDKQKRIKFGKQARAYTLQTYGWDNIARQYVDVYEEVAR